MESKMESVFRFQWGSQKLEPKIGIPNLATSKDLGKANDNTITTQQWVNLLLLMLNDFKNIDHCNTMDCAW